MATLSAVLQMLTTLSPRDRKQLDVILTGESIEDADCSSKNIRPIIVL